MMWSVGKNEKKYKKVEKYIFGHQRAAATQLEEKEDEKVSNFKILPFSENNNILFHRRSNMPWAERRPISERLTESTKFHLGSHEKVRNA